MTTIQVHECDLDGCDTRKEVKAGMFSLGADVPEGWVRAANKQFCGYEHLIVWAQAQIARAMTRIEAS